MPMQWGNDPAVIKDWMELLGQEKKDAGGKLPSVPGLVKLAAKLSADADDIKAWWELV